MNILPGEARGATVHLAGGITLTLDQPASGAVLYGIRPEHLDLVPPGSQGGFDVTASVVESTGTTMQIGGKAANQMIHALFADRADIKRGEVIGLKPRPGRSHLFSAETQLRIG